MYYKFQAHEINEDEDYDDSYSSDCNEDDMDSEPMTQRQ